MRKLTLCLATLFALLPAHKTQAASSIPEDKYSAVVLVYHRVGEETYPDSNIRTEQFLEHLQEITNGDYTVMPLSTIINAVKNHQELPPRALAITFEGAYKSAYTNAMLKLAEEEIPFTVFYSSGQLDGEDEQYLNWDDLKKLAAQPNVELGLLPATYTKLADQPEEEIRRQVNKALQRHREVFGEKPAPYFSYPFGEYSPAYKKIIQESGFKAAFGLHSGAVFESSDFFALPRFTMTERFGDQERFQLVANSLPLPAIEIEPQDPHLSTDTPSIGFSLPPSLEKEIGDLSCFISGSPQPEIETLGNRVELRLQQIPGDERLRLNCTMPGPKDAETDVEQWRWIGMLLIGKSVPAPSAGHPRDEASPPPDGPQ